MSWLFANFRYKLLALGIALFLWGAAHGSSNVERSLDVPVVFHGVPESLVITEKSVDAVNVRVAGRRAVLRNLSAEEMEYPLDLSGSKPGVADFEVDPSVLDFPRGARAVSRSPSQIDVKLEPRGQKTVRVRVDLEGDPPEGYALVRTQVRPERVRIAGARSEVLRLSEVVTEPIDLAGVTDTVEREVRLLSGGQHVWIEQNDPVVVRVDVEPVTPGEASPEQEDSA